MLLLTLNRGCRNPCKPTLPWSLNLHSWQFTPTSTALKIVLICLRVLFLGLVLLFHGSCLNIIYILTSNMYITIIFTNKYIFTFIYNYNFIYFLNICTYVGYIVPWARALSTAFTLNPISPSIKHSDMQPAASYIEHHGSLTTWSDFYRFNLCRSTNYAGF